MTAQALSEIISRSQRRPRAALPFLGGLTLARARVHEFCGPSRRVLALLAARGTEGTVLWVQPEWQAERLYPEGLRGLIAPGRLIFVTPRRGEDLFWCVEEALRSGAAPLVVGDLAEVPGLTPMRRLQLAAEAGAERAGRPPTGFILTPGAGGAAGAESRWRLAPGHAPGRTRWHLSLLRARTAAPQDWTVAAAPEGGFLLERQRTDAPPPAAPDAARPEPRHQTNVRVPGPLTAK